MGFLSAGAHVLVRVCVCVGGNYRSVGHLKTAAAWRPDGVAPLVSSSHLLGSSISRDPSHPALRVVLGALLKTAIVEIFTGQCSPNPDPSHGFQIELNSVSL